MVPVLKSEILSQLERMDTAEQEQVLNFARTLLANKQPKGVPGRDLLDFAGSIQREDIKQMERVIADDCGQVDLDAW